MLVMMLLLVLIITIFYVEQVVSQLDMRRLPSFANDNSELFIASVIERDDSTSLYLTNIMMGHRAIGYMPQLPFLAINTSSKTLHNWKDAAMTWNTNRQLNLTHSGYVCKVHINNHENTVNSYYYTNAYWVPDDTTNDSGFNRNLNILRCKLKNGHEIYKKIIKKNLYGPISKLIVEIVRLGSNGVSNKSIIKFTVPYRTRRSGYGFSISRRGSKFDPWILRPNHIKGFKGVKNVDQVMNKTTTIYSCMATLRPLEPYRADTGIPMLLEQVEHSLSIGIDHIFIGIFVDWKSIHYQRFSLALSTYISTGQVTLASISLEGSQADDVAGFLGAVFLDDYLKWIHHNQCLYMSKGQADYVVIHHASEMISLSPKFNRLDDLLYSYIAKRPCYYLIQSYGLLDPKSSSSFGPGDNYWASQWFSKSDILGPIDGWEIIVAHTSNVWSIGWHVVGPCSKESKNDSLVPWSTASVNHKTHALTIPLEKDGGAAVYFYRGVWEEFQLSRPRNPINHHLQRYGDNLRTRLTAKGFSIKDSILSYRVSKDIAERYYPAYFHHLISHKGKTGRMSGTSNNSNEIITVNLSVQRNNVNEAKLPFVVDTNEPQIVIGRNHMKIRDGSWIECSGSCKNFKEILRTTTPFEEKS